MQTFEPIRSEHVLLAMEECDRLGKEAFLRRYGFGTTREYTLWHHGVGYDSKAIVGVALRHANGTWVTAADFRNAGTSGAAQVLRDLGFEVFPATVGPDTAAAPGAEEWTDASDVGDENAREAWVKAARDVLVETAGRYHAVVTYKQLSSLVQTRTAIRTSRLTHYWLNDVLARIARECHANGEPLLSSLCVNAQGSVGQGYAGVVTELRGETVEDPDDHAAQERLACYTHFGAELPEEGGVAALTPTLASVRDRLWRAAKPERPANVCPKCNMATPASGECDNCG